MRLHRTADQNPLSEVADDVLLADAARGAQSAVEELVRRYGDRLQSYVVRIVRDPAAADDLVQELFVRALAEAHRYDRRWPLLVWLFRIARNLSLDLLRRDGMRRQKLDELALRQQLDHAPAAVTTAEHREFQVALERALQELPESFRSVFLLRDGEELSYEEIAEVLDISVKTVSSRLHRARQQLRALLQEHLER